MVEPEAQAENFLMAMFGDAVDSDNLISIWTLGDKKTKFFSDAGVAADYAMSRAEETDVYFGVGLYQPGIESGRGTLEDVTCITSGWADVDYGADHKKEVPPDESEALKVIARLGIQPSMSVYSGYGIHTYWMLKEPVTQDDGAAKFAQNLVDTLRFHARSLGYELDAVHDLTRVLRVPGTFNHKNGGKKLVTCEFKEPLIRYDEPDLRDWFVDLPERKANKTYATVDSVIISLDREPPAGKLSAALANDRKFKRTWERQRVEMKDQSASAYDMAIANFCVSSGWSDQETVDLIVAWRKKHSESTDKALRMNYISNTIRVAKSAHEGDVAVTKLQQISSKKGNNKEVLEQLRSALKIPIARWIKLGNQNSVYSMILDDEQDIKIGSVETVMSPTKFRGRIYDASGMLPLRIKPDRWDQVCIALAQIEEYIPNEESAPSTQAEQWVSAYLHHVKPVDGDRDLYTALAEHKPFKKDDCTFIHTGGLMQYVKFSLNEFTTPTDMWNSLRASGWKSKKVSARNGDSVICRMYWFLIDTP